jgi:hypothetical protein
MNTFVAAADILGSRILEINEQIITRQSLLERAARIAKDAAPYVHSRLAQTEHTGNDNKPVGRNNGNCPPLPSNSPER